MHGVAFAEPPFDGYNKDMHGKWINRATVEFNNAFFMDSDTSDRVKEFLFQPLSNKNADCQSKVIWNWETLTPGVSETSPYDDAGTASEAGLQLKIPSANGTDCPDNTKNAKCPGWTYVNHGAMCRIKVDDTGARLINFFIDSDGNIKSINPTQAISFVAAPHPYNGKTVYVRSDEIQSPCKDVIVQNGAGQWILWALKPGSTTNWTVYNAVLRAAYTDPAFVGPVPGLNDSCDFNDDAFIHEYYGADAGKIKHTGEGGYQVYVGGTNNQGASKGAVTASPVAGAPVPGGSAADTTPDCESSGFSLNWVLCPIFNATAGFVEWLLTSVIEPLLRTGDFLDPQGPVFKIWSQFRIYANIFLIIAVIVVVFGQTIGTSVFEAYTVRTFLTRLLFVIILINLSIYLMAGFLDIINVLGSGIGALMTAPLSGAGLFKFTPSSTQQGGVALATGAIGLGAAASGVIFGGLIGPEAGIFLLLFVLLPALFGVIAIILTIVARRAILVFLAIVSPVAAALYALPNTQKYSSKFVDTTLTTAGVGVILPVIFATSNIMAFLVIKNPTHTISGGFGTGATADILGMFLGFFFTFAPLLAGGLAFKWSGGLLARGHELASGLGKKAHQGILGSEQNPNSARNLAKRRLGAAITQGQADVIQAGDDAKKGWRGSVARARGKLTGSGVFGDVTQRQSDYNALAAKQRAAKSDTGNDAEIFAGAGYQIRRGEKDHLGNVDNDNDRYFNSKGKEISKNLHDRGKRLHGKNSHEVGESLMYTLGKAQTEEDKAAFRMSFGKNALEQGWSSGEMAGAYAHAAYPHKKTHGAVWFSTPEYERDSNGKVTGVTFADVGAYQDKKDKNGNVVMDPTTGAPVKVHKSYDALIDDLHKSNGAFDMSGRRHEDFQVMRGWQSELEGKVLAGNATAEDMDALGKTYEIFDAVSQRMQTVAGGDGEPSTSGASAAAQAEIVAAVSERKLGMTRRDINGGATFFDASQAATAAPVGGGPAGVPIYRAGSRPESLPLAAGGGTVVPLAVFKSAGGTYGTGTAPATKPRERIPETVRR
ncbi:MAG TPA: hypothetical protein VGO07_02730 [Candidatus Saccharimonadales bacterium]|jgi:hypothetical protein|nr:hypothetical protein [Candidatus Saccharimonadales bacterium]